MTFVICSFVICSFILRLVPLGRYVTPDEPAWVYRSILVIHLRGYKLDTTSVATSETLPLTLYWQADGPTERSYTLFVHMLEADGVPLSNARVLDLAPTILHLLELSATSDMNGRVLTEALSPECLVKFRDVDPDKEGVNAQLSAEATAEVEDRLRALGYLG